MAVTLPPSWSVAIFASRERLEDLEKTIAATVAASRKDTTIDILINGNPELAENVSKWAQNTKTCNSTIHPNLRVWSIVLGDKAHTWNQYLYSIWPESKIAFFIDGYVRVETESFERLASALIASPEHLAGTGVPSVGRSAQALRKEMLNTGGIHGNLFALKEDTVNSLRAINFKLPLGLYRTDPILGAALSFNLAPSKYSWNPKGRILVHPEVTWKTDARSIWKISDLTGQIKRMLRQGQGILEDLAAHDLFSIQRQPPNCLPETAAEMMNTWVECNPKQLRKTIIKHPIVVSLALKKLHKPREWKNKESPPKLIFP